MGQSKVEFHPEAPAESIAAAVWYAQRQRVLGYEFQSELDFAVDQVHSAPTRWPNYLHGTRHLPFRRFTYVLVYRYIQKKIQVIAVAHASRKPGYWKDRL